MQPDTHYAKSGDVRIAYQVFGQGAFDLVYVPGFVSNIDLYWDYPAMAHFLARLGSFCRVIVFDKRGTGLSDRAVSVADPRGAHGRRARRHGRGRQRARGGVRRLRGRCHEHALRRDLPRADASPRALRDVPAFLHLRAVAGGVRGVPRARRDDVGHGGESCGLRAVEGRGRGVPAMVGALRAAGRKPLGGARPDAPQQRHRRTRCAADDPRPDARDAPGRRQAGERRGRPLPRRQHPGRQVRRAARRGPLLPRRRRRPHRRRDGGLSDRLSGRYRARPHPRDRHVHRYRRIRRSGP